MENIAIIGTGNMGNALIEGMLQSAHFAPENIYATRNRIERLQHLKDKGVNVLRDNREAVANAKWIIIGVKPHLMPQVLEEIHPHITKKHVVISIATGFSIKAINDIIGDKPRIYRAMPNTASSVGEGITCICTNDDLVENLKQVKLIFDNLGETVVIEERLMDAATIIGACGVAYALRFMRAMMQGAIQIGFDSKTATAIVTQMVKGSAEMLITNQTHPEEEIDKVTTPMGCTITGLNEMEHQGFSSALIRGIVASYDKIDK